jgi:hypothetical protein
MNKPDLITRLRGWPNLPGLNLDKDLMNEAADELERLRLECASLREDWQQRGFRVTALAAELERLRAQVAPAGPVTQALEQWLYLETGKGRHCTRDEALATTHKALAYPAAPAQQADKEPTHD